MHARASKPEMRTFIHLEAMSEAHMGTSTHLEVMQGVREGPLHTYRPEMRASTFPE